MLLSLSLERDGHHDLIPEMENEMQVNFSPHNTEFMGSKGHYEEVRMSMTMMLAAGADADLGDGGHVTLG